MENITRYIYKITLLCGEFKDHYYLGKHTSRDKNDHYHGSGVIVRQYFKKYGAKIGQTYLKEILEYNDTEEENSRREKEIIGDKWITDPLCLNLMEGGKSSGMKGKKHSEGWLQKMRGRTPWNKGRKATEEERLSLSMAHKGNTPWNKGLTGKQTAWNKGIIVEATRGANHPNARQVIATDKEGNEKEYPAMLEAVRVLNLPPNSYRNICACCKGRIKSAYGYVWKYA